MTDAWVSKGFSNSYSNLQIISCRRLGVYSAEKTKMKGKAISYCCQTDWPHGRQAGRGGGAKWLDSVVPRNRNWTRGKREMKLIKLFSNCFEIKADSIELQTKKKTHCSTLTTANGGLSGQAEENDRGRAAEGQEEREERDGWGTAERVTGLKQPEQTNKQRTKEMKIGQRTEMNQQPPLKSRQKVATGRMLHFHIRVNQCSTELYERLMLTSSIDSLISWVHLPSFIYSYTHPSPQFKVGLMAGYLHRLQPSVSPHPPSQNYL